MINFERRLSGQVTGIESMFGLAEQPVNHDEVDELELSELSHVVGGDDGVDLLVSSYSSVVTAIDFRG